MDDCIRKHKGARNEMIACTWLLNNGYEVFRNISPFGDIDIVAVKGAKSFYFDVKSVDRNKNDGSFYQTKLKASQIEIGVKPIFVFRDGSVVVDPEPEKFRGPEPCANCGEQYVPTTNWQSYCSKKCNAEGNKSRNRHLTPDGKVVYRAVFGQGKLVRPKRRSASL